MQLSPRLQKIASLIPRGTVIADVGTDHGYIPVYCFEKGIIKKAIAMDVNSQPLDRARVNLTKYGYIDSSELRLSNGLEKLNKNEADVIVIAGMGGLLIADILKDGIDKIGGNTLLLLQPMIAPAELREAACSYGLSIKDEYVVKEENKFYNIFAVQKGSQTLDDELMYVGKNLLVNSPDTAYDYLNYKIRVCKNIISGHKLSQTPDTIAIQKYSHELEVYEKYIKELKK